MFPKPPIRLPAVGSPALGCGDIYVRPQRLHLGRPIRRRRLLGTIAFRKPPKIFTTHHNCSGDSGMAIAGRGSGQEYPPRSDCCLPVSPRPIVAWGQSFGAVMRVEEGGESATRQGGPEIL